MSAAMGEIVYLIVAAIVTTAVMLVVSATERVGRLGLVVIWLIRGAAILPLILAWLVLNVAYMKHRARLEFRTVITSAQKSNCSVVIDGTAITDSARILTVLSKIRAAPARHSHGIGRIKIELRCVDDSRTILLQRDSTVDNEIWVLLEDSGKLKKIGIIDSRGIEDVLPNPN